MRLLRRRRLHWSVVTSAPPGQAGEQWGDTWFARDLVAALNEQGQQARVVARHRAHALERAEDDVVVVLRGLNEVTPRRGAASVWLLWVISHPELVTAQEAAGYDEVFAASRHWNPGFASPLPLLQATNPRRFTPGAGQPDTGAEVLFVGSTRGEFRPIVRDALAAGLPLSLYGVGWPQFVDSGMVAGEFLPNETLPQAYASAHLLLNDHHAHMAELGFLSNRLFDATATATRVVSDAALGLEEVFGSMVQTYRTPDDLRALAQSAHRSFPDRDARLAFARRVATEHSFAARAGELIEHAQRLRARR